MQSAEYVKVLSEESLFTTALLQVSRLSMEVKRRETIDRYDIEIVRRPPGIRLIIVHENKMLLTREFRFEVGNWDYRLPGGKVFDDIDSYLRSFQDETELRTAIEQAARKEAHEEVGIEISNMRLLYKDILGATLEWDLYFFEVSDFSVASKERVPEIGEIIHPRWFSFEQVERLCLQNQISESRSVAVLLKYLINKKSEGGACVK